MVEESSLAVHKLKWDSQVDIQMLWDAHPTVVASGGFDTILASDRLYEKTGVDTLWNAVSSLLSPNPGAKFVMCNERRFPALSVTVGLVYNRGN